MNKEQGNNSVDYCRLLYLPCKQIEVHKIMIIFKVPKYVHIVMYNLLRSLKPEKLKRKYKSREFIFCYTSFSISFYRLTLLNTTYI